MATVTVKSGDSVSQILKNLGVSSYSSKSSWDAVRSANNLNSKYTIFKDQKLVIPDNLLGKPATSTTPKPTSTASTPVPEITSQEEMTAYLNSNQQQLNDLKDYDPFESVGSIDEVMNDLGMESALPEAPNYTEMFESLRQNYNIDNIETAINETKNAIRQEQLLLDQQKSYERGKTNRLGVIEGRIDQATRNRMEAIQFYQNQASFLTDQANSAYGLIEMHMNFKQMDYNVAKETYQMEFQQRMSIYDSIVQQGQNERDFQYKLISDQQKMASTNLSMYVDLITSGSLSYNDLDTSQKTMIHKMEVQAGLPLGFISNVKMPAGSNIKQIFQRTDASGNSYADIMYVDENGKISVEHQLLGKVKVASTGGTSTKVNTAAISKIVYEGMDGAVGKDGYVSPSTYNANKAYWVKEGGSATEFDKQFGSFINPTHYWKVKDGVDGWSGVNYNTTIAPSY